MQNGIASSAVSFKIKYTIILWLSNTILRYSPTEIKIYIPMKIFIYNCPKLGTSQMSFNVWADKPPMVQCNTTQQ